MNKLISFMHVSLDGFVAGIKGEMNWIKFNEEMFEYIGNRIEKCENPLYGRVTFEMMESYWPHAGNKESATKHDIDHSKWYNRVKKYVLSQTVESENFSNTTIIKNNIPENILKLKESEGSEILLFGSPSSTNNLIKLNLIDGFWLFVNPVVLGRGIPLFKDIETPINLKLLEQSKVFDCGVIEMNYEVTK